MLSAEKRIKCCNRIAALLMAVLLVGQFVPYWQYGEGLSASINGYVWFPTEHQGLTEELNPLVEKYPCNQAALVAIPVLLLSALGVLLCLFRSDRPMTSLLPVMAGGYGLIGYLCSPVMRAGGLWWAHGIAFALLLALGLTALGQKERQGRADAGK